MKGSYVMNTATKEFLKEIDALSERRREEIRNTKDNVTVSGTAYYVSSSGDDNNDGLTPETAWKTLAKVSSAPLNFGDAVRLKRGDIFRGTILAKEGVTYCAFGEGAKPEIRSWDKNLADPDMWELYDTENNIWKLKEKIIDCGTIVFNEGELHSLRHIPTYKNGKLVCRDDESREFIVSEQLKGDLECFSYCIDPARMSAYPTTRDGVVIDNSPVPTLDNGEVFGDLYLRCNKGNPGEIFHSIEALVRRIGINFTDKNYVRVDNICLKYIGWHGIKGGACKHIKGLHVSNCEIGWIGGVIHNYYGNDPNFPEGMRGTVARLGNGVEIYGGCDDFVVENCYLYQIYDCAITHQVTTQGKHYEMKNVLYKDNLIEHCVYGIEYFLDMNCGDNESFMENVEMCGNIIRHGGYGWGQQRHNKHTPALIKGWSFYNRGFNQTIHDNIFDRSQYRMLHLVAKKEEYCPTLNNNTYIQHHGGMIGQWGGNETKEPEIEFFDDAAEEKITSVFGDKNAKIYIIK